MKIIIMLFLFFIMSSCSTSKTTSQKSTRKEILTNQIIYAVNNQADTIQIIIDSIGKVELQTVGKKVTHIGVGAMLSTTKGKLTTLQTFVGRSMYKGRSSLSH